MDEVEHRRRRTRTGRSHDDIAAEHSVGVTPADVAERRAGPADATEATATAPVRAHSEPVQRSARSRSDSHHTERHQADRQQTERNQTERHSSDRHQTERHSSDRHQADRLPFDAHTAHPINEERDGERGLRGLVGSGATQVSVGAAMRARDAARPTDADLAEAEATLTIVHRGWVPRDPT